LQARQWLTSSSDPTPEITALAARAETALSPAAEYWLLKEVSQLPGSGEELFHTSGPSVGVGPNGLTIYGFEDKEKEVIPYSAVVSASTQRRQLRLTFVASTQPRTLDLKLDSSQAAVGLYRALTEKHAFYSCETVRSAVSTQSIRDLKVSRTNQSTSKHEKSTN